MGCHLAIPNRMIFGILCDPQPLKWAGHFWTVPTSRLLSILSSQSFSPSLFIVNPEQMPTSVSGMLEMLIDDGLLFYPDMSNFPTFWHLQKCCPSPPIKATLVPRYRWHLQWPERAMTRMIARAPWEGSRKGHGVGEENENELVKLRVFLQMLPSYKSGRRWVFKTVPQPLA